MSKIFRNDPRMHLYWGIDSNNIKELVQCHSETMGQNRDYQRHKLMSEIKRYFKKHNIELITHNIIILGSEYYNKNHGDCLNKNIHRLLTCQEWDLLSPDQQINFNNLTQFPFEV